MGLKQEAGGQQPHGRDPSETELRAAIAQQLGADRASVWFGDEVHLRIDAERIEVVAPNGFFRDWIQAHFATTIVEVASTMTGRPLRLAISVQSDVAAPRASVLVSGGDVPAAERPLRFESHPETRPSARGRRLDDFITGPSNQLAHAASMEMVQGLGATFNPLFIHGGIGLGKSHLMEGIAAGFRLRRPGWNVVSMTAEMFTNRFLEAMRAGTLAAFRSRMRGADAMLIDDINFVAAKRATQVEFLHTYNALLEARKPIVLTADRHPAAIARLTDELATRFVSGMVVPIDVPDFGTRCAIVRGKCAARGVNLEASVVNYVAEHVRASVRELEGALQSLLATATLVGRRVDIALAQTTLREMIRQPRQVLTLQAIEVAVCRHWGCEPHALRSPSKQRSIAKARAVAMYLARRHVAASYAEIGAHFGGRNHATVIAACRNVERELESGRPATLPRGATSTIDAVALIERTLGA